ncbi:gamma-glutamylputrescine oxidase [Colwellia chukchiensis]|uniref:Gamma-glutamylputrescine oxidase n=1 Tax=Colwellia chukchiensis TaxID=641665 RepID=A0A1H7QAH9_9GAMM|nr:FAD-binding oxidoreductase [Colwellia chukchiensis]SEL44973.1 gamma-glutamylputrescine oxidase [Colwellia chukchiensis]
MSIISHTGSYYTASANDKQQRSKLNEHIKADICVVGSGFTGLSSALHLAEKGYKVVILEGSRIGFGASGRNGGQLVNSYSRDMDFIEKHYGKHVGTEMGKMAFEGANIIRRLVHDYQINCDLKPGGIFAACNNKQLDEMASKQQLWAQHGHTNTELLSASSIQKHIGTDRYVGGLLDNAGGHIHPLNLALGEAAAFEKLGGVIYEDSKVTDIVHGKKPVIKTESGSVTANFVVVAGNAYLEGLLPKQQQKSMPCGTQIITTEVLPKDVQQQLLPTDVCVEDCNYLLDYFRLSADGRLIYGGGTTYGARDPEQIESIILPKMLKTFPALKKVKIDYAWTGNFLLTLMRLPQFGRINDNVYYAQGYSGHGVTSTHLAGKVISDAIAGQAERFDVFAGLPQHPFPGGRVFRIPYITMGAWYYAMRDKLGI